MSISPQWTPGLKLFASTGPVPFKQIMLRQLTPLLRPTLLQTVLFVPNRQLTAGQVKCTRIGACPLSVLHEQTPPLPVLWVTARLLPRQIFPQWNLQTVFTGRFNLNWWIHRLPAANIFPRTGHRLGILRTEPTPCVRPTPKETPYVPE